MKRRQTSLVIAISILCACGDKVTEESPTCVDIDYMTDAEHCGACGHSCGGGTCAEGVCSVVTLAQGVPQFFQGVKDFRMSSMVVDDRNVYIADGIFNIVSVPKEGGPYSLVISLQPAVYSEF